MLRAVARRAAIIAALSLLPLAGCQGRSRVDNPVLRVDLRGRVPARFRKRSLTAIAAHCRRDVVLAAGAARQRFAVHWRVVDIDGARFITGVEVTPEGGAEGGGSVRGSGRVDPLTNAGSEARPIAATRVVITFHAKSGCSEQGARLEVPVRADDPSCERPKQPKIFSGGDAASSAPAADAGASGEAAAAPASAPARGSQR